MKLWVITDMHLLSNEDSSSVIKHCHRPKNFTDIFVENWNKLVKPEDTVINLGDVFMPSKYRTEKASEIIKSLPGTKILTIGNHDSLSKEKYYAMGFNLVVKSLTIGNIFMNHYPVELEDKTLISLAGHHHSVTDETKEEKIKRLYPFGHRRSIMLSSEATGFTPVPLLEFVAKPKRFIV